MAQSVAQPDHLKASDYPNGTVGTFTGNGQSLIDAISKIEHASGGKVLEIRFSDMNGAPGFHAVIAKGNQINFLRIEALTGQLTEIDVKSVPAWMLDWRQKADVHFAEHARVPLWKAIQTAEEASNGPAIAAGIARSASNPNSDVHAYNILVDQDGRVHRVSVDDSTDEVIADPQALAGWP
jgi:uncharacterized membrane protein YkoI